MNIKQKLHELRESCKSFTEYQKKSKLFLAERGLKAYQISIQDAFESFLSSKTCIHQTHRKWFSDDEIKKAFFFYLNSNYESKCQIEQTCRLSIYKNDCCYLHWLLQKKASDSNQVGNKR